MKNKIITLFSILLLFSGCDKSKLSHIVEIDLPEHEPKLTSISIIKKNHSSRRIFVSHSKGILDSASYQLIDDATVKLYKDDEILTEFTFFEDSKHYHSPYYNTLFESGDFEMEIAAPGFETIRAKQTLPKNATILGATYTVDGTVDFYGNVKDLLEIEIDDDGAQENFYSIGVSVKGKTSQGVEQQTELYGHTNDVLMKKGMAEEFFPDETFNGGTYVLRYIIGIDLNERFDLNNGGSLDEFNINILSYTKDYFEYSTAIVIDKTNQFLPFTEPVLVKSNWDNGYGIFSVVNMKNFKFEL